MFETTDIVIDKIITLLKAQFPATLAGIDATLTAPRDGSGGQEDCYYYGQTASLPVVFPAIRVEAVTEEITNLDREFASPLTAITLEVEMLICAEDSQKLTRNTYKYAEAVKEIFYNNKTINNTVASCEFERVAYSNIFNSKEGSNIFKSFVMSLKITKV